MRGRNFLKTVLSAAEREKELRFVDDQIGAPTWSRMVAVATALIAGQIVAGSDWQSGVYHLPSAGETSWRRFAVEILGIKKARGFSRDVTVVPVRTEEYSTTARRPKYCLMSGTKIHKQFGIELPSWREQLSDAMEE
jgi:dTDP-4-dehydrorhamnose reductase